MKYPVRERIRYTKTGGSPLEANGQAEEAEEIKESKGMAKVNVITDLAVKECPVCGVFYALPQQLDGKHQENGEGWYCPNGHTLVYKDTEAMRLRHRLDQTEAELDRTRGNLDGALRQVSAHKGAITRMKNRSQNGVCQECHRHFENLERHMKTKHKGETKE